MSERLHPAATDHLPIFISVPGESDVFFTVMVIFTVLIVLAVGTFYLRLHALPERLAHGAHAVQFQVVAVLALLALFTHNHIFWIAALLLALVRLPDFWTPLASMAQSLAIIAAGIRSPEPERAAPGDRVALPPTASETRNLPDELDAIPRQAAQGPVPLAEEV